MKHIVRILIELSGLKKTLLAGYDDTERKALNIHYNTDKTDDPDGLCFHRIRKRGIFCFFCNFASASITLVIYWHSLFVIWCDLKA